MSKLPSDSQHVDSGADRSSGGSLCCRSLLFNAGMWILLSASENEGEAVLFTPRVVDEADPHLNLSGLGSERRL